MTEARQELHESNTKLNSMITGGGDVNKRAFDCSQTLNRIGALKFEIAACNMHLKVFDKDDIKYSEALSFKSACEAKIESLKIYLEDCYDLKVEER